MIIMFGESDMGIFFIQPGQDKNQMRKTCRSKRLSMVLSADYIQIQMKLPTLQRPLAFKVLQENHMSLDAAADFAAKSFGYSKTLQSSNFWCLILLFLHLGINIPVLYVHMLFNTVWLCRGIWTVLVNVNFLVFLVVSLGLCKMCLLFPHWLIGTPTKIHTQWPFKCSNVWQN